jgi:hypothetical protein
MKKTLGLGITVLGLLMIAGGFIFTASNSRGIFDSASSLNSAAGLVYSGFIVFGIGLILFATTIEFAGTEAKRKK